MQAELEVLKRAFARRTEKMGKMPKIARPPRTPAEIAERRTEQALLRAEHIVTEEKTEPVPETLKKCHLCGGTNFRSVGTGKPSEVYSYVPGYFRRVVHTREVVACRCGGCVITAPPPERWSDKTRYDSSFVAHLVVSKCLVVTPLYRLEQSFARLGMPIARSTMNDLFRRAAQKLEPLRAPLFDVIKKDFLVHVDETSFTLTKQTAKAFIWAFVGKRLTGYRFELTRGGDAPLEVLGDSPGAFLCDDYRGYDPLEKRGLRQRCGCLAHVRRKFFETGEVPEAKEALDLIAGMYGVEHEAEHRAFLGTAEHLALRRTYARPLFVRLLLLSRELRRAHGPKTLLGRAAHYVWRNLRPLGRFLRDPRIRLDNNLAENALRLIALGRKNFLFVHSEDAGKELALLYSLVVSCTRVAINPVEYIADVLERIDKTADDNLSNLLPDRWKPHAIASPSTFFDA
ncbi:IS66 family transposase [Pendulispora albinea]|uniref:IS66 family transposase n=1 Tax=Pendulispora albinea TaxID=2741071 RepID=A0ABZ2LYP8_9BACT